MQDKNNAEKYMEFYKEKEDFDVLFFGSSRMLDGVYPIELWDTYQITSFNMAQHAESLPVTYWQIKNVLNYTTPKVIVVDVSVFWGGQVQKEDEQRLSYLHKSRRFLLSWQKETMN